MKVPHLGQAELFDNHGVVYRASTVALPLGLPWDSLVFNDTDTKELKMKDGLSSEVWDYIQKYSGLEKELIEPTNTWGSSGVS